MTSVTIVEYDPLVRDTLCTWINSSLDCYCACVCSTGKEALAAIPRYRPDVVLMEAHLPGESGIICMTRLKERLPELRVVLLTSDKDRDLVFESLKSGACGFLLKPSSRDEILWAIAQAQSGGAPMTGEIARRVVEVFQKPPTELGRSNPVSRRETEVLSLLSKGMSNKAIAAHLGISYGTVCVHLRRIYGKLHVRSRTEAVVSHLRS
jgi:DNA-binding NarL/FixJ family response regulator